MISLTRGTEPRSLQRNCSSWGQELCEARRVWHGMGQPGTRPRALRTRYGGKSVRRHLEAIVGRKCWYCERTDEAPHVEHFRPQTIFPLLAYQWDNLLLACSTCNAAYKSDHFPLLLSLLDAIEDTLHPETQDGSEAGALLNPCLDPVEDHLTFDDGYIVPKTPRGRATVDTCGLDRTWLNDTRRTELRTLRLLVRAWETAQRIADPRASDYQARIRELLSDHGQFAGMNRAELNELGYDWRTV